MGIPKTIYSDKGSEFNNAVFLNLMKKNNIQVIFAIGHAPFVESFNRTMKNRMYKYMSLYDIDEWYKIIPDVLNGYNSTPHTVTGIAPNDVTEINAGDVLMKLLKRKKTKNMKTSTQGTRCGCQSSIKFKKVTKTSGHMSCTQLRNTYTMESIR